MNHLSRRKVQWARGFFRAWIVLSLVWVVLVGLFMAESFPTEDKPWFGVEIYGDWVSRQELLEAASKAKAAGDTEAEGRFIALANDVERRVGDAQRTAIWQWVMAATIPSLVVLALGTLIGWAARGFRPDPS